MIEEMEETKPKKSKNLARKNSVKPSDKNVKKSSTQSTTSRKSKTKKVSKM